MLCTYVLASVLVALTFLGHFVTPSPMEITNEELTVQKQYEKQVVGVEQRSPVAGNDRSTNLKYVIAIQSLAIWSVIKKRMLTIKTRTQIGDIVEKSPDQLTDQELIQLRQACQDGLKCVSVDHLIMLQTVEERTDDGKILVRQAITNIIKVLTEYTTEYHQTTYKYAEIKDADDETKLKEMVTIIVEDNKELCKIDVDDVAAKKNTKDDDTINTGVSNVSTNKDLSSNETPDKGIPYKIIILDDGPSTAVDSNTDNTDSLPNSTSESSPNNVTTVRDDVVHDDPEIIVPITDVSSKPNGTDASINTIQPNNGDESSSNTSNTEFFKNNYVDLYNGGAKNGNSITTDITSSGPNNKNEIRKGFVEDGNINNGEMVSYSVNNGLEIKGAITMTKANNGIVSVGVVNNGPTNYGAVKNETNNGKVMTSNNINSQTYVTYVDSLYSTIIKQFKNV